VAFTSDIQQREREMKGTTANNSVQINNHTYGRIRRINWEEKEYKQFIIASLQIL